MSLEERSTWDRRYASGDYVPRSHPTPFLLTWLDRIPVGRALDVATGAGRNALALAHAGFTVDAIDISSVAIDMARTEAERRELDVNWIVDDLDTTAFRDVAYDLITVMRYRSPELWPRLQAVLARDGWVLIEHHLRTTLEGVAGPSDDTFRLAPGELLEAFRGLRIVHYSEAVEPTDDGEAQFVIARMAACAGDPGW